MSRSTCVASPTISSRTCLPSELGDVAHHARKSLHAVGERPHAAGQRLVVQAVREIERAAVEHLELVSRCGQNAAGTRVHARCASASAASRLLVQRHAPTSASRRRRASLQDSCCMPLEPQQRFGERLEPARLDQRLAGEAEQAIEVLGGDAQHAVRVRRAIGRRVAGSSGAAASADSVDRRPRVAAPVGTARSAVAAIARQRRERTPSHVGLLSSAHSPMSASGVCAIRSSRSVPPSSRSICAWRQRRCGPAARRRSSLPSRARRGRPRRGRRCGPRL